jgi:proline dehydrogenase
MAGNNKCTIVETERRVNECLELISVGKPRRKIHAEICAKYGVGPDQADRYMTAARKILREMWNVRREDFVAEQMSALEHLADLATEGKQYSAAAGARATMARMVGVDAPRTNNGSK